MSLLRIGAFARRACVSVKTLRFYDSEGIFHPARIDARTGYRYYSPGQLERFGELRELRTLGCSLLELRAWSVCAQGSPERTELLLSLRERSRGHLFADLERLCRLDERLRQLTPTLENHRIPRECRLTSAPALTSRDRVRVVGPAVYRMFEDTERRVARQDARAPRSPFLLFHDGEYRDRNADVEVCVPIKRAALTALSGRLVEGTSRAACVCYSGSYDRGRSVYALLEEWLSCTGARRAGPVRETYLRFGADECGYKLPGRMLTTCVSRYRTLLQVPIAEP